MTAIVRPKVFWPLTVDTSNRSIKVNDGATDTQVNVATGTYTSPGSLATALQTALNAALAGVVVTIRQEDGGTTRGGFFKIAWTGPFTVKWTTTTNPIAGLIGWFVLTNPASTLSAATYGASTPYGVTATYQHINGWYSPVAPKFDTLAIADCSANTVTRAMSGQTKHIVEAEVTDRKVAFEWLPAEKAYTGYENANTTLYQSIERWWRSGRARARYFPDALDETVYVDVVLDQETLKRFQPTRQFTQKALYTITMGMHYYIP